MKIRNTGRYALGFAVKKGSKEIKIEFDRRRIFLDTGNIATTGITEVSDETYELLKENKLFAKYLKEGILEEVSEEETSSGSSAEEVKAKDAEIKALKKQLKDSAKTEKQLKEKDEEIASLKEKLEALSKEKGSEADGF